MGKRRKKKTTNQPKTMLESYGELRHIRTPKTAISPNFPNKKTQRGFTN